MTYFAGCNRWVNKGNHKDEPVGTTTAMHECGDCEILRHCTVKQKTEIFAFTDDVAKKMDQDWREMALQRTTPEPLRKNALM